MINTFYHRLLARGKAQKAAITAAMRQCLTILNAMVKPQPPWSAGRKKGPVPEQA